MRTSRYRKKPVVVEAVLVTEENAMDVARWEGGKPPERIAALLADFDVLCAQLTKEA